MQVLPTKFESILREDSIEFGPLILKVEEDLRRFSSMVRFNRAQGAGALAVVRSAPGTGKTTAAYAATVLLRELFAPVLAVPGLIALPLREIPRWLADNLSPSVADKTTLVLIDGRESTDDQQGLRDVMGSLNNLVRGRPDLLFVWPTTDQSWADRLVRTARDFGSESFCPDRAVFEIAGPDKSQWIEAVSLIMAQLNSSWDEFGINEASATALLQDHDALGEFFTAINKVRTAQEDLADSITGLPEVVFVVTSHSEVVGHVARLRNPKTYRVRTDELIGSAPRSEPGKYWQERGASQRANLAWVSSLLQVKLVSLTPSTVAYACSVESALGSRLRAALDALSFAGSRSPGNTAYSTTDLARFFAGEPVPEVLSTNKGKTSDPVLSAYDAIQALSSRQHRDINKAILTFAAKAPASQFDPDNVQYEVSLGDDAIADAVVQLSDRRLHLEFHHLSKARCKPNTIATYIMKKLRTYAIEYNLTER